MSALVLYSSEFPFASVWSFALAMQPCLLREIFSRSVGSLPGPQCVHLKSSVKDCAGQYCECQQNQQKLGSLEVYWISFGALWGSTT